MIHSFIHWLIHNPGLGLAIAAALSVLAGAAGGASVQLLQLALSRRAARTVSVEMVAMRGEDRRPERAQDASGPAVRDARVPGGAMTTGMHMARANALREAANDDHAPPPFCRFCAGVRGALTFSRRRVAAATRVLRRGWAVSSTGRRG